MNCFQAIEQLNFLQFFVFILVKIQQGWLFSWRSLFSHLQAYCGHHKLVCGTLVELVSSFHLLSSDARMVSSFKEFDVTLQFVGLKIVSKSSQAQDRFCLPLMFHLLSSRSF